MLLCQPLLYKRPFTGNEFIVNLSLGDLNQEEQHF